MITRRLSTALARSKKSFLLLGPRQTGKSTLIQSLKPELTINLADQETFFRFLSDPGLIKKATQQKKTVFIDEVQRLPSLLNTIQVIVDENQEKRFWMTGSSARKLRRGQANLLPGRIFVYELGPLTLHELEKKFDLNHALSVGLLPGVYLEEDSNTAKKTLKSYAATYLKEEIQAEALTKNLEGFSRFFDVLVSLSGDFIDFTKLSSQALIERVSARRYFDIMVDTLVIHMLEPFAKSDKRRLVQHPKFYFFDTGVLNGALGNFTPSNDRKGVLFEHLFLQMLLSEAKAQDQEIRVTTYRTEAGAEVDFIIETKNTVFAVEVKASTNIGKHDLRGLKSFKEFYNKKYQPWVVYMGTLELEQDNIPITPIDVFMKKIFG